MSDKNKAAYRNPTYNPNWEELHNYHDGERRRAREESCQLVKSGKMDSDAYREARARGEQHDAACKAALKAQHETVQDYADWVFRQFPVDLGYSGAGIPIPQIDPATMRTMEDVDAAWSRIHCIVSDSAHEKTASMPVSQPEGMTAFADATSPNLIRTWREFTSRDLYPAGSNLDSGVWTLMTIDEQKDGLHVCFMHRWDTGGISVTNAIEALATAVYREARALAEQSAPDWIGRLLGKKKSPSLDPARFHFYDHTPPHGALYAGENFCRVAMTFKDGE